MLPIKSINNWGRKEERESERESFKGEQGWINRKKSLISLDELESNWEREHLLLLSIIAAVLHFPIGALSLSFSFSLTLLLALSHSSAYSPSTSASNSQSIFKKIFNNTCWLSWSQLTLFSLTHLSHFLSERLHEQTLHARQYTYNVHTVFNGFTDDRLSQFFPLSLSLSLSLSQNKTPAWTLSPFFWERVSTDHERAQLEEIHYW